MPKRQLTVETAILIQFFHLVSACGFHAPWCQNARFRHSTILVMASMDDTGFRGPRIAPIFARVVPGTNRIQYNAGIHHPDFQRMPAGLRNGVNAGSHRCVPQNIFLPAPVIFAGAGWQRDNLWRRVVECDRIALWFAGLHRKSRQGTDDHAPIAGLAQPDGELQAGGFGPDRVRRVTGGDRRWKNGDCLAIVTEAGDFPPARVPAFDKC